MLVIGIQLRLLYKEMIFIIKFKKCILGLYDAFNDG